MAGVPGMLPTGSIGQLFLLPIEVRVVWLDEGNSEWKVLYNAPGEASKVGLSENSGEWREI